MQYKLIKTNEGG